MGDAHGNADDAGDRRRLVNWGELLATCAASALATLVLSRLGVAGTIVGAAVTPLIITLTSTALSSQAERAREAAGHLAGQDDRRPWLGPEGRRRLTAAVATAAAATAILVAGIAFTESVTDEPVSNWGRGRGSESTSGNGAPARESPTPTGTPPGDGSPTAQPSPTPTASLPTATPTPVTQTPTPTGPSSSPTAASSAAAQP